jgi:Kef-type K+ transport system membrane component KefB
MGMVPRGEVGFVVAQIGIGMAVISDSLYAIVLMMAVATTLIAPPFLRVLFTPKTHDTSRVSALEPG